MADVVDPEGRAWAVRRRWDPRHHEHPLWDRVQARLPRRSDDGRDKWRQERDWSAGDVLEGGVEGAGCLADAGSAGAVIVLVALVAAVAWFVLIPLLILLGELALLVVAVGVAVVGRLLFKRPWIVEARLDQWPMTTQRWEVVGWRASGDHVRLVREQLANGMPLPEPIPSDPNDPGGPP